jgi:hypothetical protein
MWAVHFECKEVVMSRNSTYRVVVVRENGLRVVIYDQLTKESASHYRSLVQSREPGWTVVVEENEPLTPRED